MSFRKYSDQPAEFVDNLKRAARRLKTLSVGPDRQLARFQDDIAISLGHKNWSMLMRKLSTMKADDLVSFQRNHADAIGCLEMREYIDHHFFRLNDAASAHRNSGHFIANDVKLIDALYMEFRHRISDDLIQAVAAELEALGPWGMDLWPDPADPNDDVYDYSRVDGDEF